MKKLSIIAGLVFTTVFFASCESNELMPQSNYSRSPSQTVDFQEPEFAIQKRPSVKALENTIIPAATEVISTAENKLEQ
jgi:PBP1b-binding outer membrane lipoprotein LpoB